MIWKNFSVLGYCLIKFWDSHKLTILWNEYPFCYFTYHQGFPRLFFPVLFCYLTQLAGYVWTCVCWDKIVTIYLTENVKSFFICTYTLVLNIWASFPDLGRNTLVFCYCWWVMINKVTFTAIINIRLRCSKRCGGLRALTTNMMDVMSSMGWPWSVRAFVLFPN